MEEELELREISREDLEARIKLLKEIAEINASEVYGKLDEIRGGGSKKEICGMVSKDGVELADEKHWGEAQTSDFKKPEEYRKLAELGQFVFSTHESDRASAQDIFSSFLSTGEVIYTQSKKGKRTIIIVVPEIIMPIDEIISMRKKTYNEAHGIASETGNFPQAIFNDLAEERLKFREVKIKQ